MGLGSLLSDGGIDVFTFNYRGTWESEGIHSYKNYIDDILAVSSYLHSDKMAQDLELHPSSITFIGYCYGGGAVLIAATMDTRIRRIAVLAPLNLGEFGRQLLENEELRAIHEAFLDETMGKNGMVRGPGGKMMHQQFIDSIHKNDLFSIIDKLLDKEILILGGERDEDLPFARHVLPLYTRLKARNSNVYLEVYDADHGFSGFVDQVAERLIMWAISALCWAS